MPSWVFDRYRGKEYGQGVKLKREGSSRQYSLADLLLCAIVSKGFCRPLLRPPAEPYVEGLPSWIVWKPTQPFPHARSAMARTGYLCRLGKVQRLSGIAALKTQGAVN